MKKAWLLSLFFGLIVLFSACSGVPPTYYYRVDYDVPAEANDDNHLPLTIAVQHFSADLLYEGDRIVYRNSPYEVNFYYYRRWVAPPKKLVTEEVYQHFKKSGMFAKVVRTPAVTPVDYTLGGQIQAFEEWDASDGWFGLVSVQFQLRSSGNNEVVWEKTLSEKTRAAAKKPVQVVQAISQSLNAVTDKALQDVVSFLKNKSN